MRAVMLGLLVVAMSCRRPSTQFAAMLSPIRQPINYLPNVVAGDEWLARGTDPGWTLTINPLQATLMLKMLSGDSLSLPLPNRVSHSDGSIHYQGQTATGAFSVVFKPDSCVDRSSGERFDYRVELKLANKSYTGCGLLLPPIKQLEGSWVLSDFPGYTLPASAPADQLPHLNISLANSRVTGTTGCNRLSGTLKADAHTLALGPLATTKMACLNAAGALETPFLQSLASPVSYQISHDQLLLWRDGNRVMTFRKTK